MAAMIGPGARWLAAALFKDEHEAHVQAQLWGYAKVAAASDINNIYIDKSLPEVWREWSEGQQQGRSWRVMPAVTQKVPRLEHMWSVPSAHISSTLPPPCISVIIPVRERREALEKTLKGLGLQRLQEFEVIVIDDGSQESVETCVREWALAAGVSVRYIRFVPEASPVFRPGLLRNWGAAWARGEILSFLDADIEVPATYLQEVVSAMETSDVLMAPRWERATGRPESAYWADFYQRAEWGTKGWAYLCSHSLSLSRAIFAQSGGFCELFQTYGYEDLELGYRLWQITSQWRLLNTVVWHQSHGTRADRMRALEKSAAVFLARTGAPEVAEHLKYLLQPRWKRRLLGTIYLLRAMPLFDLAKNLALARKR